MGILSLSDKIAQSRSVGKCERCGADTEVFLGKRVCDACVKAKVDGERKERRITRLRALVGEGAIEPDTQYAWSRWRWPSITSGIEGAQTVFATSQNVWLWGPTGVGKSHLARVKLVKAVENGVHDVAEVSANTLVKTGMLFRDDLGRIQQWQRAGVLLLDDIDKVAWRREHVAILWELLDKRSSNGRQTVVTANMTLRDFHSWLRDVCADNHSVATGALDRLKPVKRVELKGTSRR